MDVAGYLIYYLLTNIIFHPLNVFLLFTAATTIVSFFFIYVGKIIYSKFKKKNNTSLFITTAATVFIYLIVAAVYDMIFGGKVGFSIMFWLFETVFAFIIIKIIEKINSRWIEKYNLPQPLKFLVWALLGSAIAWFLIIIVLYSEIA